MAPLLYPIAVNVINLDFIDFHYGIPITADFIAFCEIVLPYSVISICSLRVIYAQIYCIDMLQMWRGFTLPFCPMAIFHSTFDIFIHPPQFLPCACDHQICVLNHSNKALNSTIVVNRYVLNTIQVV